MYNYEILTKELLPNKQAYLKNILIYFLSILLTLDIPFILISGLFFILVLKLNSFIFFTTIIVVILIQLIIITINCTNDLKQSVKTIIKIEKVQSIFSFTEQGISITKDNIKRNINWTGVKSIKAYEHHLCINFNIIGSTNITLYYKYFDVPKDTLLSEIEKYIEVRR